RLGTASAISLSPVIAQSFGLSAPLLAGALLLLAGFVMFIVYTFMDRQVDIVTVSKSPSAMRLPSYVATLLKNPGFWLIVLLCVLFYSSLRPFLKFATDVLINKYGVDPVTSGWIVSLLPYGTIVLTPLFGSIYDRIGHGALLMLIGCALVFGCHVLLALPMVNQTWVAVGVMIMLGVAFSLVPSAMWPSVPKLVPIEVLGTSYSIIYYVQNIGLMLVPMLIGNIIDQHTAANGHVDFTAPMSVFALFALAATLTAAVLLVVDLRKNYGLERANIESR
ncbi:MAG: MFS transporter, partial [Prevotella sp.]|nr:MFS transporter [Prevotella sp.]